jgi:hypothetical protein
MALVGNTTGQGVCT